MSKSTPDILLDVENLQAWIEAGDTPVRAVDGVSFSIRRGETFALLGESGCGKSMTALAIMRLLPEPAGRLVSGHVRLQGEDLTRYTEMAMRRIRGNRIAMIFQEPMTSLNPVLTIGAQIGEVLRLHKGLSGAAERKRILELLDDVGIPDAQRRINEYPHQLSGGMKQRVMIAIALAGDPDLLIADEPTTALDVTIQTQVLDLLRGLQQEHGMALLLISHDLGVVAQMADHVGVMYAGQIVELADRKSFFEDPRHPYSRKLFESLPDIKKRNQALDVIPGSVPRLNQVFTGCRFAERCEYVTEKCRQLEPQWTILSSRQAGRCHYLDQAAVARAPGPIVAQESGGMDTEALLQVDALKVYFPVHRGILKRTVGHVHAVDGIDLRIQKGRTLALVGESGCGKTTVGKGILQLLRPYTHGRVEFKSEDLMSLSGEALRKRRADLQIIFQDPYSSMNPRMRIDDIISEGMKAQRLYADGLTRERRIEELLEQVGLSSDMKHRYPHEFSGGQRQRICIARALAVSPKLIVCDEPTSALDVSVQAQILNLLKRLQMELGLSYLFITHDLSVVAYLAHDIAVMYLGRIVEHGPVEEVLDRPKHPYTRALLSAVPEIDAERKRPVIRLEGDIPSPIEPPSGCHFHPRCPDVMPICREQYPGVTGETHTTRCFLYSNEKNHKIAQGA